MDSQKSTKARTKPPSLLACIPCRKSHLKCDGQKPLCRRCSDKTIDCIWIESRRGYRDYRKSSTAPIDKHEKPRERLDPAIYIAPFNPDDPASDPYILDANLAAAQGLAYQDIFDSRIAEQDAGALNYNASNSSTDFVNSPGSSSSSVTSIPRDMSLTKPRRGSPRSSEEPVDPIDVFYKYFHTAHPFVVPQQLARQQPGLLPEYLRACMNILARIMYTPNADVPALQKAASVIFTEAIPDGIFKVQALMVYTCACYSRYEQMPGAMALDAAIRAALRIGLNKHSFSLTNAPDSAVLQESFRRTWWTLFIIDGLVTVIGGQQTPFRLHDVYCDVAIPGDDNAYNDLLSSPAPRLLADLRNRTFSEDTFAYSSFAFSIEAMYIMGAVFSLGPDTFAITDPQVESIDASISNFLLSLPPDKREVIADPDGIVDETLLNAHMIINWAAIQIHRPRSTLTFIRNHYSTICTRPESAGLPALDYASHTSKTIRAANNIISLAGLHRPLAFCTPCMMCGIATAATVHLPAYAIADRPDQAAAIKERLQLGISALGRFAEIWPRAAIARAQVASFAREVLTRPSVFVDSTGMSLPNATPVVALEGSGVGSTDRSGNVGVGVGLISGGPHLPELEFVGQTVTASIMPDISEMERMMQEAGASMGMGVGMDPNSGGAGSADASTGDARHNSHDSGHGHVHGHGQSHGQVHAHSHGLPQDGTPANNAPPYGMGR